jgi:hypothetical protein
VCHLWDERLMQVVEIVLGTAGNTRSVIRSGMGVRGVELAAAKNEPARQRIGPVSQWRSVWISFDGESQTLSVWDDSSYDQTQQPTLSHTLSVPSSTASPTLAMTAAVAPQAAAETTRTNGVVADGVGDGDTGGGDAPPFLSVGVPHMSVERPWFPAFAGYDRDVLVRCPVFLDLDAYTEYVKHEGPRIEQQLTGIL